MLNQIVIVGRLKNKEFKDNGTLELTLAVPRSYKNVNGEYDTDIIKCLTFRIISSNINEYCEKDDVIGIKGRLQCLDGKNLEVVAEKVTYLTSRKENKDE